MWLGVLGFSGLSFAASDKMGGMTLSLVCGSDSKQNYVLFELNESYY